VDLTFGILISTVLLFALAWDMVFIGIVVGFFLLAIAYMAGCESLRKGDKSE
jgi:succinate-acetate transporter protein